MYSKNLKIASVDISSSTISKNINKKFREDDPYYIQSIPFKNTICEFELNESISEEENQILNNQQSKNIKNNDPIDHKFNFHYPIIFHTKYDYVFKFRGKFSKKEFLQRTIKIRSYPLHLKTSLFFYEKCNPIRKKDFSFIKIYFNEIKKKGNKLYKKRKFREAVENYLESYSLLKWIEFKDQKNYKRFFQSQIPILDNDLIECSSLPIINDDESEVNSNEMLIEILLCLSITFMELRHYKWALCCLNEILEIDENNTSALLRRSQCRLYNKSSNWDEYALALKDIKKCFKIFNECKIEIPQIFTEHYNLINNFSREKDEFEIKQLKLFFLDAFNAYSKYPNKYFWENYDKKSPQQEIQLNVLKTMNRNYKVFIKFYTESKDLKELNNAFKEIEHFMEIFKNFQYFHSMNIPGFLFLIETYNDKSHFLTEEMKSVLHLKIFQNFLEYYKNYTADSVFQAGNFNIYLIKEAINKVNKEMKNKEFESESNSSQSDSNYNDNKVCLSKNLSIFVPLGLMFSSIIYMFLILFFFLPSQSYSNEY